MAVVADSENVYSAMLNQTQIRTNNNKYYYLEILSEPGLKKFTTFFIWGRVGAIAGKTIKEFNNFSSAFAFFEKKFMEKAKCLWGERAEQQPTGDTYVYMQRTDDILNPEQEDIGDISNIEEKKSNIPLIESSLSPILQVVMEDFTSDNVREKDYGELNLKEMPLGKLTKSQIKKGFEVLMQLYETLDPDGAEAIRKKIENDKKGKKGEEKEKDSEAMDDSENEKSDEAEDKNDNDDEEEDEEEEEEEEEKKPPTPPARSSRGRRTCVTTGRTMVTRSMTTGNRMATRSSTKAANAASSVGKKKTVTPKKNVKTKTQKPVVYDGYKIERLSSLFYSLFPVKTSGMAPPPKLDNLQMVKEKIELLMSLLDIDAANELMKNSEKMKEKMNKLDAVYKQLNCKIEEINPEKDREEYDLIAKYLEVGHCPTHNLRMKLDTAFRLDKEQDKRFVKKENLDAKRMLLWHGSRISNFIGILSQGLRIAPPEVPPNGYMFGKGLYFADAASKSANYCTNNNGYIYLLLVEVAVGKSMEYESAHYVTSLPKGYMSTLGLGKKTPNPDEFETIGDGIVVPCGQLIDRKKDNLALLYDEYIVYDVSQVRFRYLLRVKIN